MVWSLACVHPQLTAHRRMRAGYTSHGQNEGPLSGSAGWWHTHTHTHTHTRSLQAYSVHTMIQPAHSDENPPSFTHTHDRIKTHKLKSTHPPNNSKVTGPSSSSTNRRAYPWRLAEFLGFTMKLDTCLLWLNRSSRRLYTFQLVTSVHLQHTTNHLVYTTQWLNRVTTYHKFFIADTFVTQPIKIKVILVSKITCWTATAIICVMPVTRVLCTKALFIPQAFTAPNSIKRRILDIHYSAQHGNQQKDVFAWIIYHDPCC